MSWRNLLVDDGDKLKVYLDNVEIYKGENKYTLPLSDISMIVLDGMTTSITTRLLSVCSNYNVALVTCDKKHLPSGVYLPFNQHSRSVKVLNKQINWKEEDKKNLWNEIIKYKIYNQSQVMYYYTKNEERYIQMKGYIDQVVNGDKTNREGHAAKVYFNTLFGNDFYRDDDCIINAMLDYGYAIIRAYIARVITSYGYNSALGIFHKNEYNSFCLADDLLEVFRPVVDLYTMSYILNNEKEEILTQEKRSYLVNILSKRIVYENKFQKVSTIIDKFVINCMDYLDLEKNKKSEISNIKILTSEGLMK